MKLVLVTGLSGAGKSLALKTMEDMGFEAIDNLPLSFLPAIAAAGSRDLVIGADSRGRDFSAQRFTEVMSALRKIPGVELQLVFLDCDDEVLQRRFTETRRRHPLAQDRPVADGICQERVLLAPVRELADVVIDTSAMASPELRIVLTGHFGATERRLAITVMSFSYRNGLPREADMVFDVRFLRNPHYVEVLKPLTGKDQAVGEYIAADPDFPVFFERLQGMVLPLLPRFLEEGKHYVTIAIGCTGGRHRSVYVAEQLAKTLHDHGFDARLIHRELA